MSNIIYPPNQSSIKQAIGFLQEGKIIGFPTETVYGIGCDATNDQAISALYRLKERDSKKPLQVMVKDVEMAKSIAMFDDTALALASKFFPGPLTLVLNKKPGISISSLASAGNTIGIRIPNHPIIQEILNEFGKPLAATSINISGEKPALTAKKALNNLPGIEFIIDGGTANLGVGSTVVDLTTTPARILREGSIPRTTIERYIRTTSLH